MSFNRFTRNQLLLIRAIKELSLCLTKNNLIDIVKKYQLKFNVQKLNNTLKSKDLNALKSSYIIECKQSIKEDYYATK
jgi:hypothetical protein